MKNSLTYSAGTAYTETAPDPESASFARRFWACFVDSLIVGAGAGAVHYFCWMLLLSIVTSIATPAILKGVDLSPIIAHALLVVAIFGFVGGFLDCFLVLVFPALILWQFLTIPQLVAAAVLEPRAVMVLAYGAMSVMFLCSLLNWFYHAFLEHHFGATPGKMLLGVRVYNNDSSKLSFLQASLRHYAKMLDGVAILITIGIYLFFCRKAQIHDWLSGTKVCRG
jgi:Predicted membrane protein/domain